MAFAPEITIPATQPMGWNGPCTFRGQMNLPAGNIKDADISAAANIAASKCESRDRIVVSQAGNVATVTTYVYVVKSAATIGAVVDDFRAAITETIMTGDRTVTFDLQKSTGAGAFATVLTAVISFANGDAVRTPKAATLAAGALNLVAGDILKVIVTYAAGTTGTVPQGAVAQLNIRELPA